MDKDYIFDLNRKPDDNEILVNIDEFRLGPYINYLYS